MYNNMIKKLSERQKASKKLWRVNNIALVRMIAKKSNEKCRERIVKYRREYYLKHKDGKIKDYRIKNKEKLSSGHTAYLKNKYHTDIQHKLKSLLRGRLWFAVKGDKKPGSAVRDLGCSVGELKFYLEGKFVDGMAWNNFGKWHIDHVVPLSFFDLTNRDQLLKACHYTNLQPLWAVDNLRKSRNTKLKTNKLQCQ